MNYDQEMACCGHPKGLMDECHQQFDDEGKSQGPKLSSEERESLREFFKCPCDGVSHIKPGIIRSSGHMTDQGLDSYGEMVSSEIQRFTRQRNFICPFFGRYDDSLLTAIYKKLREIEINPSIFDPEKLSYPLYEGVLYYQINRANVNAVHRKDMTVAMKERQDAINKK